MLTLSQSKQIEPNFFTMRDATNNSNPGECATAGCSKRVNSQMINHALA